MYLRRIFEVCAIVAFLHMLFYSRTSIVKSNTTTSEPHTHLPPPLGIPQREVLVLSSLDIALGQSPSTNNQGCTHNSLLFGSSEHDIRFTSDGKSRREKDVFLRHFKLSKSSVSKKPYQNGLGNVVVEKIRFQKRHPLLI